MEKFVEQCREIISQNGLSKQKRKFVEEGFELIEAITEMQVAPSRKNLEHVIEEMADSFVVWRQFAEYYDLDIAEIMTIAKAKAERTIARMKQNSLSL
jgi:NTP pyrophosphatase (non-canonical NTP hydrolase)